ncbi:MAG TPA: hypothetical protein VG206_25960 [Terriglobia bacterium]|nr:hypothetical protein [Terriglobia bacterium]
MTKKNHSFASMTLAAALMMASASLTPAADQAPNGSTTPFLPSAVVTVSTVPSNGDVNPYGVAFVPQGLPAGGVLKAGDILVSNFNNSQNLQGTGTTIVRIHNGVQSLFFQGTAPLGLSTALQVLKKGYVLVGNFPSVDGTCGTASDGSVLVINSNGQEVSSIINNQMIVGPWDSTVYDQGATVKLFVANGLNGTISRLNLSVGSSGVSVTSTATIASGYMFQCDAATFVDAPTGLVYEPASDTLYVASTLDNEVFAVPHAGTATQDEGTGSVVYQDAKHLHGALAMTLAPNGHLLVSDNDVINSDPNQPSEIVEFTTSGQFVKELSVDPNQGGSFGLNVQTSGSTSAFAAVDDNKSNISIWTSLPN